MLAGGCFWCTEAVFKELRGVTWVMSGYAAGQTPNPSYKAVCSGTTGHAEVVQVVYDPKKGSYERLLEQFWLNHDPTVIDRQFCDSGSQYRPGIYWHDDEQRRLAEAAEARARTADAVYLLVPILRVKGAALIDLDRAEEARTWLNEALEGCPEAEFERGFILAELARAAGPGDAAGLQAQAEAAWTDFGWVGSARYPRADPR